MAVNLAPYKRSLFSQQKPLVMLLPVAAGSTTAIKRGEVCELSGGVFTPITGDDDFTSGVLAICDHEITSSHQAGYYPFVVPRPGDLFEFELAAAAAAARGAALYYSTSQVLATSGTNTLGDVVDHSGFPLQQGNADVGDVADRGSTVGSANRVLMTIKASCSYYSQLQS